MAKRVETQHGERIEIGTKEDDERLYAGHLYLITTSDKNAEISSEPDTSVEADGSYAGNHQRASHRYGRRVKAHDETHICNQTR